MWSKMRLNQNRFFDIFFLLFGSLKHIRWVRLFFNCSYISRFYLAFTIDYKIKEKKSFFYYLGRLDPLKGGLVRDPKHNFFVSQQNFTKLLKISLRTILSHIYYGRYEAQCILRFCGFFTRVIICVAIKRLLSG